MWNITPRRTEVLVWLAEPLLNAGVRAALSAAGPYSLVIMDGSQVAPGNIPNVVITDWASGIRFARRDDDPDLPSIGPCSRILTLCAATRGHSIASGLRLGVHGVLRLACTCEELIAAVLALSRGSTYVCPELVPRGTCNELTMRQDQVLRLLAVGQGNKMIARHLGIAVGTVKTHVKAILAKLDASSRTEAASIALERGVAPRGVGPTAR